MTFTEKRPLGRTGLMVGRLGIASSYRASAAAYEEAFAHGCNYFTWGTFIRGRHRELVTAVRNLLAQGKRDDMVLSLLAYGHSAWLHERFLTSSLRALGTDYGDVLLLGYYSRRPAQRIIDGALALKERGLTRFIGITSHNRKLFPELAGEGWLDLFHVRYNAAHRAAETETFPQILAVSPEARPGVVSFTATRWGALLKASKMPKGEAPLTAAECYRFVLTNPTVDVCMTGPRSQDELRENLAVLAGGPLDEAELARVRRIGDFVHGRKRGAIGPGSERRSTP